MFVNYGMPQDYRELERRYNITVAGKIVIARHLRSQADEQVLHAQEAEAAALLLFPDTSRVEWHGEESSENLPNDAVRRDSLLWNGMVSNHRH